MKPQAILAGLGVAAAVGLLLLFTAGLLVALAVAVPVAVVVALVFGKTEVEIHHERE